MSTHDDEQAKPQIAVIVYKGLVEEVRSNVPIDYSVCDLDVFDDCAGGLEGECSEEYERADGRMETHNRIRREYAEALELPQ